MRRSSWPSSRQGEGKGHLWVCPLLEGLPKADPAGVNRLRLHYRQRFELEELRRQMEDNSALAGRALKEELEKAREEQERRHQVRQSVLAPRTF